MTRDQEAFFGMALKVRNFYAKHLADLTAVPAVAIFYAQLAGFIADLINADTGSRADLTGYAIAKSTKRELIEQLGLKLSNAIASYALVSGEVVLQKRADFPSSKWYSCSEEELVTQATIIKNLATPIGAGLNDFGASLSDIAALDTALGKFTDAISDPTLAIDQRKEDNKKLLKSIDDIRSLLNDNLDVLMRSFESNQPSLYALYKSARAIDANGSTSAATTIAEVLPNSVLTAHDTKTYSPDTFYTLQNIGNESVFFSLSTSAGTEGPEVVLLNPGETRSRLADNLSAMGTFLILRNANTAPTKVKIWVE